MLTNTERQQIVEEVNAGTYGIDEALDDIAAAQKGEEVRKALYAEALVLNREGHAGSTDMIARQQIANLQTSVNGQISTLRSEVGDDIDDLETALNSGLATQNGRIAVQNATIANVVANYNVEYGSTELWASTGETGALAAGTTVTLSEDVSHFDYIDIYSFCGNSNVLDTVPVDAKLQSNAGYALRWVNLSDPGSGSYKAYVRIVETRLHIIGTTLTIDHQVTYRNGEEVNISGAEVTQSNRSTYMGEFGIMKIVGRKITANTEIEDVRIGADGTEYESAGQAVRGQITEVKAQIPLIDASLATAGKAADAKATGDAIAGVNGRLGDVEKDLSKIDKDVYGGQVEITYVPNEYVANDGKFTTYNNWSRSDFIPVPNDGNGVRYTLTGRASSYCAFYSDASESSYLRMFSINKTDGIPYREQTVPDNARYFVISNYTADIATFTYLNPPQLEVGLVGKVAELDERVTALEESPSGGTAPEIILPPYGVAVVGHEFNMYTENVVICKNLNDYIWTWKMLPYATQYNQYDDRFSVIPATGSERIYTLSLTCVDKITGATLISASMSLIVVSDSALTGKKMLMIGDSLTAAGYSAYEIASVLSAGGVESLGTITATPWIGNVQKSITMEGRGGWNAYDYMHTASKNDNTNAFLNPSTNLFDFSYYMEQQGYSDVDIVMLNLGTNGTEDIQRDVEAMGQIIASIHSYNANIPVVVHLTPPPATQNGWTYINHGTGAEEFRLKTLAMVKAQIEAFGNKQSEKTYISCVYGCLDRYHDFAYREVAVSQRNPFVVTRQIQNVHPASYGYYKFADVYWGMIEHLLN